MRHQPRTASYNANSPANASTKQTHRPGRQSRTLATSKAIPNTVRARRPRQSIFRAKKLRMARRWLLELVHGDIRMRRIRNEPLPGTIYNQVHFFQDGLADQDFIAKDKSIITGPAMHDLEADRLCQPNGLLPAIGVFHHDFLQGLNSQAFQ